MSKKALWEEAETIDGLQLLEGLPQSRGQRSQPRAVKSNVHSLSLRLNTFRDLDVCPMMVSRTLGEYISPFVVQASPARTATPREPVCRKGTSRTPQLVATRLPRGKCSLCRRLTNGRTGPTDYHSQNTPYVIVPATLCHWSAHRARASGHGGSTFHQARRSVVRDCWIAVQEVLTQACGGLRSACPPRPFQLRSRSGSGTV
jgi:hypothetical protein